MDINNDINLFDFAEDLIDLRKKHKTQLPIRRKAQLFVDDLFQLLFPHYSESKYFDAKEIESKIYLIRRNLRQILLSSEEFDNAKAQKIAQNFILTLPNLHKSLFADAEAIFEGDPAAESIDEVILAYPGFLAIAIYRFAHKLFLLEVPLLPRIMTEYAHQITGIDIHPGAEIGANFFIDHGTGIVIGETTVIGNNVKIYQGVTLGALSIDKKLAKTKRHPTIEDNVIIYSNAVILGGSTVIGKGAIIGGNVWLTRSVAPNSVVYHRSEISLKNDSDNKTNNFII